MAFTITPVQTIILLYRISLLLILCTLCVIVVGTDEIMIKTGLSAIE